MPSGDEHRSEAIAVRERVAVHDLIAECLEIAVRIVVREIHARIAPRAPLPLPSMTPGTAVCLGVSPTSSKMLRLLAIWSFFRAWPEPMPGTARLQASG